MTRKKVGIQLPKQAQNQTVEQRWALELEGLAPVADVVEIRADTPAEFAAGVADVDAIITSWGLRIDRQVIENLKRCVVIGVGSVGVDMVDIEAATAAGIVVTNVPDVFIEEVADHAMMLLLDVARRTTQMARMARDGEWYQARPILSRVPRLLGQTLGLFAFGNVARCTARRAQAFGLRVLAYDPYVSELEITAAGVEPVGFAELLERSDYLSVHAPLNDETFHAIDAKALRADEADGGGGQHRPRPDHRRGGADRGAEQRDDRRRRAGRAGGRAAVEQQPAADDGERAGDARTWPRPRRGCGRRRGGGSDARWRWCCAAAGR